MTLAFLQTKKGRLLLLGCVFIVAALVATSVFFWQRSHRSPSSAAPVASPSLIRSIEAVEKSDPEKYTSFVDGIKKWEARLVEDPRRVETYITLGLEWKSLADQVRDPRYYERALELYERGSLESGGQHTGFLINAGNMLEYLGRYEEAEKRYLQALAVTPGDQEIYYRLTELYQYHLDKTPEEILSLLDTGIKTAVVHGNLERLRHSYLKSIGRSPTSTP